MSNQPHSVLYLSEMSAQLTKAYAVRNFDPNRELANSIAFFDEPANGRIEHPEHLAEVLIELIKREGFDLIVIDTLAYWIRAKEGEDHNSQTVVTRMFAALRSICETTGASIVVIAHTRKESDKTKAMDMDSIAGSVAIRASTDANTMIRRPDPESPVVEVLTEGRDTDAVRWAAMRAAAMATGGEAPRQPAGMASHFYIRPDILEGRVVYKEAEANLLPKTDKRQTANPMDPELQQRVLEAVEQLTQEELAATAEGAWPICCYSVKRIFAVFKIRWKEPPGKRQPGEDPVKETLIRLAQAGALRHFQQREWPMPPGAKATARGGYALPQHVPASESREGSRPKEGQGAQEPQ